MNLVRKYKLSKLLNHPLSSDENDIISFIKNWISDVTPYTWDKYPNHIFYVNNEGLFVFSIHLLTHNIIVRYKGFWALLEHANKLSYDETKKISKFLIEEKLQLKYTDIVHQINGFYYEIEEHFTKTKTLNVEIYGQFNKEI